ncbi:HdeD family acid-resistance protein [Methylorubrum extorquens]
MVSIAAFNGTADTAGRSRWWFTGAGALLLLFGIGGLFMVVTLTTVSTLWYGALLLVAGIVEIIEALMNPRETKVPRETEAWRSRAVRFLAGLLYLFGGLYAVLRPLEASLALTLILGATLIASGVARALWGIAHEAQASRAAVILFALLSVLLGAAIIAQWPYSGLWAIGLFVSCDLLAAGLSWLWVGLFGRPQLAAAATPYRIGAGPR